MDIITPQMLWDGYDRTTEPSPNIIIEKPGDIRLYFGGHSQGGCTVRVYARLVMPAAQCVASENLVANPATAAHCSVGGKENGQAINQQTGGATDTSQAVKKPPVIILVGSSKSDIDNENVSFFGAQGFAVLLVDYFGRREGKTHFTVYPKTIDAFWEQDPDSALIPPKELKKSCWYYWTTCILHAVTYLEKCGLVDTDKIGISGIDEGAALVFKTSFCKAIKAGVTFFGGDLTGISFLSGLSGSGTAAGSGLAGILLGTAGDKTAGGTRGGTETHLGNIYSTNIYSSANATSTGSAAAYAGGDEMLAYKAGLDSRAYAKNICFPVLINAATNEKRGTFDYLADLFNSTTNGCFCVYPSADRAVSMAQRTGMVLWFRSIFGGGWKVPPKPILSVFGSDGAVYAEVSGDAQAVKIYYAEENPAPFRNWKEVVPQKAGENKYLARLEIFRVDKPIHVFANISYEGGFTFSTPVLSRIPTAMGISRVDSATSRLLYRPESGTRGWIVRGDSLRDADEIKIEQGPQGLKGVCGDRLITYKTGDSRYCATLGSVLQLIISAKVAQEAEVLLLDSENGNVYRCYKRISDKEWTILTLTPEDFKSAKGSPKFDRIAGIKLRGQGIILNSMLWV